METERIRWVGRKKWRLKEQGKKSEIGERAFGEQCGNLSAVKTSWYL